MAKTYALTAAAKPTAGKGAARALRRQGRLPAVIYGAGKAPMGVSLDSNAVNVEYLRGHMFTTLCDLNLDGKAQQVLVRDLQLHPVSDRVEHVDFLRVTDKISIAVAVPVHFVGEEDCPALVEKCTLNIVRHEVDLLCRAAHIPDQIEVSLAGKQNGDSINISDAALPEGTRPTITGRDFTIATLVAPRTVSVDEEVEAADAAAQEAAAEEAAAAAESADDEKDA